MMILKLLNFHSRLVRVRICNSQLPSGRSYRELSKFYPFFCQSCSSKLPKLYSSRRLENHGDLGDPVVPAIPQDPEFPTSNSTVLQPSQGSKLFLEVSLPAIPFTTKKNRAIKYSVGLGLLSDTLTLTRGVDRSVKPTPIPIIWRLIFV